MKRCRLVSRIPHILSSWVVNFDVNWGPLSVTMSSGRPWFLNTYVRKSFAVPSAVISVVVGQKWAIFVNLSTQTRTVLKPADLGSSTMKSMDTEDQGAGGIGSGCSCP